MDKVRAAISAVCKIMGGYCHVENRTNRGSNQPNRSAYSNPSAPRKSSRRFR